MLQPLIRLLQTFIDPKPGDDDDSITSGKKGQLFERVVQSTLSKRCDFYGLYRNVLLPKGNGTTECDLILLDARGLYVIECKNYSGRIYGDGYRIWWSQYLGRKSYTFYSPVLQNKGHCEALRAVLPIENLPIFSLVVFADKASLSRIQVGDTSDVYVCNTSTLLHVIRDISKDCPATLSNSELSKIDSVLSPLQVFSAEEAKSHADYVKDKYQGSVCPLCSGALVVRKGKTKFLGCSNFPRCRYTRPINDTDASAGEV